MSWVTYECENGDTVEVIPELAELLGSAIATRVGKTHLTQGERNTSKTHCPRGHPYAGDNLVYRKKADKVARACRTCRNEAEAIYRSTPKGNQFRRQAYRIGAAVLRGEYVLIDPHTRREVSALDLAA